MIEFYNRNDWQDWVTVGHQSSDKSHVEEIFDYEGFHLEKEYFLQYILNQKRNLEDRLREEVYFSFVVKCDNFDDEIKHPEEYIAHIVFNLHSLNSILDERVILDNCNIIVENDSYIKCGYTYEKQLYYIKQSDLVNYLNDNIDTYTFFTKKLIEFKFSKNEFYELDFNSSCLIKKKELNISEHELQYKTDTSILNYDFITVLENQDFSISSISGLIKFKFEESDNSGNDIEEEIPF